MRICVVVPTDECLRVKADVVLFDPYLSALEAFAKTRYTLRNTWSENMEQAAGCTSITRTQPSRIQASAKGSSVPALIQFWQQLYRMPPSSAVVTF